MKFKELKLKGAYSITLDKMHDDRGFFARTFCVREFSNLGLETNYVQCNWSRSLKKDTLRGLHFQNDEHSEVKLVRCTSGRILDVIVDMRKNSKTFLSYHSEVLSQDEGNMLYIPRGFAHGFITLEENSEIFYQVSNYYTKDAEGGILWNDPKIGIKWPEVDPIISAKDAKFNPI